MPIPLPIAGHVAPTVSLRHLDELWFQVGGTRCNLTCQHCFISCSPHNHSFGFLPLAAVQKWLDESIAFGVKEYYFTGGEPFLNPDLTGILDLTLQYGPATVLTNGTVLKDDWLNRLRRAEADSPYSLEFRVSIDGFNSVTNDPLRGAGTFDQAMAGVRKLVEFGFLPIITVARMDERNADEDLVAAFIDALRGVGYKRPRLKILPALRLGAEVERGRGYAGEECVTEDMMVGFDADQLLCSHARLVSDRGVHVCPILLEAPDTLMGWSLKDGLAAYPLRHHACYTCYQFGSICANPTGGAHHE